MITESFNLRNEDWQTPEQVRRLIKRQMEDWFKDCPEYEAGPPLRVTVTVESIPKGEE